MKSGDKISIADTLSLETLEVSDALAALAGRREDLELAAPPEAMTFGPDGNLPALVAAS